jgi:hypothetical protein
LPLVSYALLSVTLLSGFPAVVVDRLGGEQGVIENVQVVFLLFFLGLAGHMLCARPPLPPPRLRLWLSLLILGGLYTLGEEISWGQHYIGWVTPTWLADLNGQHQTNLHNVDRSLFFGIPRLLVLHLPYNLLLTAIYAGGLVYPIISKGARHSWYWPTPVCLPWAVLTACASLPLIIGAWMGRPLPVRHGEMQEYFVYGFLVTYLASLHHRCRVEG